MRRFIVLDGSVHYTGQSFDSAEQAGDYCNKVALNAAGKTYYIAEIISKVESRIKVTSSDLRVESKNK